MKIDKSKFKDFYETLDQNALKKHGADHLSNNLVLRTQKARTRIWFIAWSIIIIAGLSIGIFYLWILYQAKTSGTKFSELRDESIRAISGGEAE